MKLNDMALVLGKLEELQTGLSTRLEMLQAAVSGRLQPAPREKQPETLKVKQAAAELGLSEYTTRQYCNLGKMRATKAHGRGKGEWHISPEEVQRVKQEGPKAVGTYRT